MQRDETNMCMGRFQTYVLPGELILSFHYKCAMTSLTNSEGLIIHYTNEFVETVLWQFGSS